MNRVEAWLRGVEAQARRSVDERVAELLDHIRAGAQKFSEESWDQANERHAEEFIASLREAFPDRVFEVSRPPLDSYQEKLVRRLLSPRHTASGAEAPEGWPSELSGLKPRPAKEPATDASGSGGRSFSSGNQSAEKRRASAPDAQEAAGPVVLVERQKLRPMARRTTNYNYIFTVPGRRRERLVLVAHYDTWRGPGADDNTTGEEITKQYLLDDLRAPAAPELTHVYILAGSEECGLIGFTSQVLLAVGLGLANMALTKGIYLVTALGVALVPLAKFRFGVSGSREYVHSLTREEVAAVQSVISVDSVGEGKMYIPESSLGADFVRAFIPFQGYHALNDVLEEAAHLNAIQYNSFIAGGTTDHVSFLEVNSTFRDTLGDWLGCPRWLGCHKHGKRKIPAAALVALNPGKASPLVFGGKIHTPEDTADRVYPGPLGEALRILDYWYYVMQGGERIAEPREAADYHYAQLYRVQLRPDAGGASPEGVEYWLAMKDAVEPNRRNINGLYRVEATLADDKAFCRGEQVLNWGVHTRLRHEVEDQLEGGKGTYERVHVRELHLESPAGELRFAARRAGWLGWLNAATQQALGSFERFLGSNTFLAFFGAAFLLAKGVDLAMTWAFLRWMAFQQWFFEWFPITLPVTVGLQLWAVLWLIGTKIPTLIDNNYKHLNKSDNLRSLRRVAN